MDHPARGPGQFDARTQLLSACAFLSAWAVDPPSRCTFSPSQPLPEQGALPLAITEIRGVAVSIQEALSELRGNALTALAAASALRDSAIAADRDPATMDVAFAALASEVERAEAQKTAALEAELVVEDALLERAERVFGVVTTAARNASADELVAERPALLAQLDALFDALAHGVPLKSLPSWSSRCRRTPPRATAAQTPPATRALRCLSRGT